MSIPSPGLPVSPAFIFEQGNHFLLSVKMFYDKMPQFGDNGLEITTGVSLRPKQVRECTVLNADGTWLSCFELDDTRKRLSDRGYHEFEYQRSKAEKALEKYMTIAARLMQLIVDSLSKSSKATLELRTGQQGYLEMKSRMDTLGVWKLIMETHTGVSSRALQVTQSAARIYLAFNITTYDHHV